MTTVQIPAETTIPTEATIRPEATVRPEAALHRTPHYQAPGWITRQVFNRAVRWLTRRGVSVRGSRVLEVRGRTTGTWRSTPVNLLPIDDTQYLVAPRGETQWVRNVRANGEARLRLGRTTTEITPVELADDDAKIAILREYLRRWKMETGVFFDGKSEDSSDAELRAIAPDHPVFRLADW